MITIFDGNAYFNYRHSGRALDVSTCPFAVCEFVHWIQYRLKQWRIGIIFKTSELFGISRFVSKIASCTF